MARPLLVFLCAALVADGAAAQQATDLRGFFLGQPIESVLAAPPAGCTRTSVPALPDASADMFTPPTEMFLCSSEAYVFYYLPITRRVWNIEYNFQCGCTVSDVVQEISARYKTRFRQLPTSEAPIYWQLLEHLAASTSDLTKTIEIKHFADARAMGLPFDGDFFAVSIVDTGLGLQLMREIPGAKATSLRTTARQP